jgi:SARP family transcriptional regulator, regulator of embCAB operon
MKFGILGPLALAGRDGRSCVPSALKPRILLANFLTRPGRIASTAQLIEELWDGRPPRTATTALQVYISNLRKIFDEGGGPGAASAIMTCPPGYVFTMAGHEGDLERFESYRDEAERYETVGDRHEASALLRLGLKLWRGAALADVRSTPQLGLTAKRLDELHIATLERRIELDLTIGRHGELVGELYALAGEHPSRERIHEYLMIALYNSGRPNEALRAYMAIRASLKEHSGLDPSNRLRELQRVMLARREDFVPVGGHWSVHASI